MMSLDEAYLDITEFFEANSKQFKDGCEVVQKLRSDIFEKTGLTASAGIAPNTLLAKIASDMNKPNGQFEIKADPTVILDFMKELSIRKVSGIGNVTEQLLNSIGT